MKGAQIGGTEVGNNFLGYIVHLSPGPVMLVNDFSFFNSLCLAYFSLQI